jgi:putative tricarboxylic transport membrane protein
MLYPDGGPALAYPMTKPGANTLPLVRLCLTEPLSSRTLPASAQLAPTGKPVKKGCNASKKNTVGGSQMAEKGSQSARAYQDIIGGTVLILIAALGLYLVQDLPASGPMGFGSGTAPRLTAYAVIVMGAIIIFGGYFGEGERVEGFATRGVLCILGAVLFFALAIQTLGLVLTGIPLVLLAGLASPDFRAKEGLIFAIGITLFCVLLFPYGLAQPIPVWPKF